MSNSNDSSELSHITKLDLKEHSDFLVPETQPALIPFRDLKADSVPIIPLPDDPCPDIFYPNNYVENRCVICTSPWRVRLEHEFIAQGRKPNRVRSFFEKYFGAKVTWESIATHMAHHCDLSKIQQDGQLYYQHREDDLSIYKFREDDLALIALTDQLYEMKSLNVKSVDAKMKLATVVSTLSRQIAQIKKDRDNAGSQSINFFKVLMDIHDKMKYEEDKMVVREVVKQIREQLMKDSS